MNGLTRRNDVMAKANQLANLIRERGEISFGEACIQLGIHGSTLYQRIKYLEARFPDIKYDHGIFSVMKVES